MLSGARGRLASALRLARARPPAVAARCLHASGWRRLVGRSEGAQGAFDPALLEFLVCPLSKKPLRSERGKESREKLVADVCVSIIGRYEASTNELINEELGIAYPVIDGIPCMVPEAARKTHQNKKQDESGTLNQN